MEVILQDENLEEAIKRVKSNKGVAGVDKMTVGEIDEYFKANKETIKKRILEKKYRPQPVKRVYIQKTFRYPNRGGQGHPTSNYTSIIENL